MKGDRRSETRPAPEAWSPRQLLVAGTRHPEARTTLGRPPPLSPSTTLPTSLPGKRGSLFATPRDEPGSGSRLTLRNGETSALVQCCAIGRNGPSGPLVPRKRDATAGSTAGISRLARRGATPKTGGGRAGSVICGRVMIVLQLCFVSRNLLQDHEMTRDRREARLLKLTA